MVVTPVPLLYCPYPTAAVAAVLPVLRPPVLGWLLGAYALVSRGAVAGVAAGGGAGVGVGWGVATAMGDARKTPGMRGV